MRCIGKRWPQRLAAAATVAALLAYVLFCTNVHYDLGDDVLLARSFGGMVGGRILRASTISRIRFWAGSCMA